MRHVALILFCLALAPLPASAYLVAGAVDLDELEQQADLIVKAEVLSSSSCADPWFSEYPGYGCQEEILRAISVLKGELKTKEIAFRHYAPRKGQVVAMVMPQHYVLKSGRVYVVLAKRTKKAGVYRQLWKAHRSKEDQGLLWAANRNALKGKSLKAVYQHELEALLVSKRVDDRVYAIEQLDRMSGGGHDELRFFDREQALGLIAPHVALGDDREKESAVRALGSRNPYLAEDFMVGWLASFPGANIPGHASWKLHKKNQAAREHWNLLVMLARQRSAPTKLRALAIRALGRAQRPEIGKAAASWLEDPKDEVVYAAALLLGDYPEQVKPAMLARLAGAEALKKRLAAARLVGLARLESELPLLARLVIDPAPQVRKAAALILLSFPLSQSGPFMKTLWPRSEFGPLFVNALARKDGKNYLGPLSLIVEKRLFPQNWWGGQIPWGQSWDILFKHLQKQPARLLKSGAYDAVLEALESPLAAEPSGTGFFSSSEPRDLYALYLQKGLKARARAFRAACTKAMPYDMAPYFKQVDAHPDHYLRR